MKKQLPHKDTVFNYYHVSLSQIINGLPAEYAYKGIDIRNKYMKQLQLKSYNLHHDQKYIDAVEKLCRTDIDTAIIIVIASCK